MTKPSNSGNIRVKRLFQLTNSTSLAITLPRAFIKKLNLTAGRYVKCELRNEDSSILVEGLNVG
ncbi:MAG: AbrB/MazE/SpoVT family DNA-binding domain-containing protein [Nitrososphaeraceae archaeon]